MIKNLFKDIFTYGIGVILVRAVSFVLVPFYTRVFSPQDFGMMDLATVAGSLVAIAVPLEITQSVPRYFSDASLPEEKSSYASTAFWFTIAAYLVFFGLAFFNSDRLALFLFGSDRHAHIMAVAVISMCTGGIFYFLQNQLRWEFKSKLYVVSNVVYFVTYAFGAILAVLLFHQGVAGAFYGFIVGGIAAAALSGYFLRSTLHLRFDWDKCKEMLGFSLPLVPSGLSIFIATYIDRFAIRKFMTLSDVGIFGVGYRAAAVVGIVIVCFQSALSPLVFGRYRESSTPGDLARIFRYFLGLMLPLILGLSLFSHELLRIVATARYDGAAQVIPVLALALLFSNMYVLVPGLFIAKKTKTAAAINIFAAILNTALTFLLIPRFGIMGGACSTLLTALATFCAYLTFSQKYYPLALNWKRIGSAFLLSLILLILYMGFLSGMQGGIVWQEAIKIISFLAGVAILEMILIDPGEIKAVSGFIVAKLNLV